MTTHVEADCRLDVDTGSINFGRLEEWSSMEKEGSYGERLTGSADANAVRWFRKGVAV